MSSKNRKIRKLKSNTSLFMEVAICLVLIELSLMSECLGIGFSYSRFVGPVDGPEKRVFVPDSQTGGVTADYIARPAYEFAYGVEDTRTRVLQNRKETRDGDTVKGVYRYD